MDESNPVMRNAPATTATSGPTSGSVTRPMGTSGASSTPGSSPRTPSAAAAATPRPGNGASGRRVKLTVSRVDPWSVMKMSVLLSVALGIAMVVMVAVLWSILSGMGVFDQIDEAVRQIVSGGESQSNFSILDFVGFGQVLSLSIVVAVIDVLLITAIATLAAFLYNVCSALVGGLQLTLTDD
jgi:hypothetical protein